MKTALRYPFWKRIGKANYDYQLIEDKDKIAIGLSGGKDSMALLYALAKLKQKIPIQYELVAITLDLGWKTDLQPAVDLCKRLNVSYYVETTDIGPIVLEHRKEHNPCSLCAKMKRGALHNAAKKLGCNKVALAHHLDDALETLLLNMFYAGKIKTFQPKAYLDRKDITIIRPLIYVEENVVKSFVEENNLPVVPSSCPVDGLTKRQEMKNLISSLEKDNPNIRQCLFSSLRNTNSSELWLERQ